MAKFKKPINTADVEDDACAPEGKYKILIKKVEIKQSSSNSDNSYLNCQCQIAAGKYKGMTFFNMFNLWNSNDNAKRMSEASFKKMVLAIFGEDKTIKDTDQLVGKAFLAELAIDDNADFGKRNKIKKYIVEETAAKEDDGEEEEAPKNKKKKAVEEKEEETADEAWAKPKKKKDKDKKKKKKVAEEEDDD